MEITPNETHNLASLEVWRARLLGQAAAEESRPAAAPAAEADLGDRASVLKRLDYLYERVGLAAMRAALPPAIQQSQQLARAAAAALLRVQASLAQAERARGAAGAAQAATGLDARLASSKSSCSRPARKPASRISSWDASAWPPASSRRVHKARFQEIQRLRGAQRG